MTSGHQSVLRLLTHLSASYAQRHADDYLACFAETSLVYGTGVDEKCEGADEIRAHLERDWMQSSSASFTLDTPHVEIGSAFAWVASACHFEFQTDDGVCRLLGRATFILVEVNGQWRIRHAHFSVPYGSEGNSF